MTIVTRDIDRKRVLWLKFLAVLEEFCQAQDWQIAYGQADDGICVIVSDVGPEVGAVSQGVQIMTWDEFMATDPELAPEPGDEIDDYHGQ